MEQNLNTHKENIKDHEIVYTKGFIDRFKKVLIDFYEYETYMDFIIIPFLIEKTLMYISLLSYSDRKHNEVDDLLALVKDNDYQIRTLNFEYENFKKDDTVTMRINSINIDDLCAFFSQKTRRYIRKGKKEGFNVLAGNSDKMIEEFYELFSESMYEHGTPAFDKGFIYKLREEFEDDIVFLNFYKDDKAVGSVCGLLDKDIIIWEWLGLDNHYKKQALGHYIMYKQIKYGIDAKRKIIDLGRSGYETGTYEFKRRFHAYPVKIDVYQPYQEDIYEKYKFASELWKKLPKPVVDILGAKLSKYLKDL